jgi:drug/metabolite transporter (DMT)-like permease
MTVRWTDYLYIAATIALTVLGQLLLKWRMDQFGPMPAGAVPALRHLIGALLDPFVLAAFVSAFGASLAWMAAMTRFELSYAYPFTSLNFIVVLVLSVLFLGETLTVHKAVGVALIVAGTLFVGAGTRAG